MARKIRSGNSVPAQLILLGRLAAQLDKDPRPVIDVFEDFFAFTPADIALFMRGYNEGEDPVDDPIR